MSASQAVWHLDPSHSQAEFAVRHLMIATVRGHFHDITGTITGDPENWTEAKIEAAIGAASIDTRNEDRDNHLRSADFFEADKYPEIRFVSKEITEAGEGKYKVVGDLTIRDVTKEVALDTTFNGTAVDPWGGRRAGFSAEAVIDRTDFGLKWNQALETGGVLVGDTVRLRIEAEAVLQAEE